MTQVGRSRVRRARDAITIHSLSREIDVDKQRVGMKRFHSQSSPSHQASPCKLYLRSHSQQKPKGIMALELYMSKENADKEQAIKAKQVPVSRISPSFKMLEKSKSRQKTHISTQIGQGIKISRTLQVRRNIKHTEGKIQVPVSLKSELKKKKWTTQIGNQYAPLHSYIEQLIRNNKELEEQVQTPKEGKIITVKAMPVQEGSWAQRKRKNNLEKLTQARKKKSFQLSSLLDKMQKPKTKDYPRGQKDRKETPIGYGVSPWNLKQTLGSGFFPV